MHRTLALVKSRAAAGDESGMSLVELLVAMAIMGFVITAVLSVLSSAMIGYNRQSDRSTTNDQARLAVEELDREIRSGNLLYDPALEAGSAGSGIVPGYALRIYTQNNADTRNPGPRCDQWRILNGSLQHREWTTTWREDDIVSGWRTIATNIVNQTVSPPVPAFVLPSAVSYPYYGGRLLSITLLAQVKASSGSPVRVQESVTGRDTEYGYPTNVCTDIPPY
jgi:prepilin-type N-terminal cleavage/methylation domain-containing protein